MYNTLSYKTKQFFWLFTKLSIVFGCAYFINHKLQNTSHINWNNFYKNGNENNLFSLKNTMLLISFSFLNWYFEILKWKTLVEIVTRNSLKNAAKQSLASLTASLITPNRIGEYGAKALYFKKDLRKKIVSLNFIGNAYQFFATLFFGFFGILYVFNQKKNPF